MVALAAPLLTCCAVHRCINFGFHYILTCSRSQSHRSAAASQQRLLRAEVQLISIAHNLGFWLSFANILRSEFRLLHPLVEHDTRLPYYGGNAQSVPVDLEFRHVALQPNPKPFRS